jgi:hypothetical protein
MARTAIDAGSIIDIGDSQNLNVPADSADITFDAGDDVNGNAVQNAGNELVLVNNTGGGAGTITFTAAPDSIGRTGSISAYSVGAGEIAVFGPFPTSQWRQSDGMLYINVSAATMELAVLRP